MQQDILILLKKEVQNKLGRDIQLARDCCNLSEAVYDSTGRTLSSSTLKRLFGVVKTPFKPSKYTLDTLAIFLGFEDWQSYLNCYEAAKHQHSTDATWHLLKKRIHLVTENSLTSLKLKTNFKSQKFCLRAFAREKFKEFAVSNKIATMFIGPDGYGKSSTLIQLVEQYFLKTDAQFKDDIVCLIDGSIFFNLYSNNSEIELLNQLINFKLNSSLLNFFQLNPDQKSGRIWIIIDDIDEIFIDKKQYHDFAENLKRLILAQKDYGLMKVLITCRPENWDVFKFLANKNPVFASCWFDADFHSGFFNEETNIPYFSEKEMECILGKLNFKQSIEALKFYHEDVIEVIKYPNFLSILSEIYDEKLTVTEVDLLHAYFRKRIFHEPYLEEKSQLFDRLIELSDWGRQSHFIQKDLIPENLLSKGYEELKSNGVLFDHVIPRKGLINNKYTYIGFCQNLIFEFILVNKWLEMHNPGVELFEKIRQFYKNNKKLRYRMIQLLTRILLHLKEFGIIEDVHKHLVSGFNTRSSFSPLPQILFAMAGVVKETMRSNAACRKELFPKLASTEAGKVLYFEEGFDVDSIFLTSGEYLKLYPETRSPSSSAFFHFMKFVQGFLSLNMEQCETQFKYLELIDEDDIHDPVFASYPYIAHIITDSFFKKKSIQHLISDILKKAENLLSSKVQRIDTVPKFEILIIFYLSLSENYDHVLKIADFIDRTYNLTDDGSYFFKLYNLCVSHALLKQNKYEKAVNIYENKEKPVFPKGLKYFFGLQADIVHVDFLLAGGAKDEASRLIDKIQHIARLLKFELYYQKAENLFNERKE